MGPSCFLTHFGPFTISVCSNLRFFFVFPILNNHKSFNYNIYLKFDIAIVLVEIFLRWPVYGYKMIVTWSMTIKWFVNIQKQSNFAPDRLCTTNRIRDICALDCPLFPNLLEMWLPTNRLMFFDFLFEKKIFSIFFVMIHPCQSLKNIAILALSVL